MSQQLILIKNMKALEPELREFAMPLLPPKKARHELIAFLNLIKKTDPAKQQMVDQAWKKCKEYLPMLYSYLKMKAVH